MILRLYETRKAAADAKKARAELAAKVGRCEMDSENGLRCYISPRLPVDDWCESCRSKKPIWEDYRKKSSLAGAALRDVLRVGKKMQSTQPVATK